MRGARSGRSGVYSSAVKQLGLLGGGLEEQCDLRMPCIKRKGNKKSLKKSIRCKGSFYILVNSFPLSFIVCVALSVDVGGNVSVTWIADCGLWGDCHQRGQAMMNGLEFERSHAPNLVRGRVPGQWQYSERYDGTVL